MDRAPGPKVDSVLGLAVLELAPTFFLPYDFLVELVEMRIHLIKRFLLNRDSLDTLTLHFLHYLDCLFNRSFDARQEGATRPGRSRANDSKVVRETWRGNSHI